MRTIIPFNHHWLYTAQQVDDTALESAFTPVTLPHTNQLFPYHNFDDAEYQFISTYRKRFTLPEPLNGRRLFLDFEGVMVATTVTLNGHTFDEFKGGYVPFSFDITDYLRDGENTLTVHVDATKRADIPPYGHTIDYMLFGGIYREVSLRYVEPVHITDVVVRTYDVLTDHATLEIQATVTNKSPYPFDGLIGFGWGYDVNHADVTTSEKFDIAAGATATVSYKHTFDRPVPLWSLEADEPSLGCYLVALGNTHDPMDVLTTGGDDYDYVDGHFGFRQAEFRDDGFYLNGEKTFLRGLNRHQLYPYIGGAAPARLQRKDADILKYELGCTVVRTSHYPQSRHFLDRCDEIGLLVFEEIPGWQHIGDEDWKALSLRDVAAMITRDRNRPSIILWGVRINESFDDTDFYRRTNALARQLDPTRPTGGVRFFQGSEFLEDVYTLNDFSNSVQEPQHTPHLITEFNGHMFPTKSWDHDARRVEHALRHARIQDRALGMGGVSGAIGWCAFDYNTHVEFGAGDRICYHGVMDIFRLPKYAAFAYASQIDPAVRPVLKIASNWTLGDYDEGILEPLTVLTNCDAVTVYMGDDEVGTFEPDRATYPYLPHPPVTVTGLNMQLAQPYDDLRVVGLVDGQPVIEQSVAADHKPVALTLTPDDAELHADGIDMTRFVFAVTDKYGNPLPYATCAVSFTVDGPGELIGENPFALVGGQAALYLKSTGEAGTVTVTASTPRLPEATAMVEMR